MGFIHMKPERISLIVTWIGLAGYAFIAPASIALSQLLYGVGLAGFVAWLILARNRSGLVLPPAPIITVIIL